MQTPMDFLAYHYQPQRDSSKWTSVSMLFMSLSWNNYQLQLNAFAMPPGMTQHGLAYSTLFNTDTLRRYRTYLLLLIASIS